MLKKIETAKVTKVFDTIGQVGWMVSFLSTMDGRPYCRVQRIYKTEQRANTELSKLVAKESA